MDYVSECPEDNGFFADALQCDRYYECDDGVVSIAVSVFVDILVALDEYCIQNQKQIQITI